MKIRDRFWLWGQNAGSHHFHPDPSKAHGNVYDLPGKNFMESAEGGEFFGIPNCCRVVMSSGPVPPFDEESEKLKGFRQLVWSAVGAGATVWPVNKLLGLLGFGFCLPNRLCKELEQSIVTPLW